MRKYITIGISLFFIFFIHCAKQGITGYYHYLSFIQSWPLTSYWHYQGKWITRESDCMLTPAACSILPRDTWVVHGLRPDRYTGRTPAFCYRRDERTYNSSLLDSHLRSRLNMTWPSYHQNITEEVLWRFEWEKHGSCVADIIRFENITGFFSSTLALIESYNIGDILAEYDIVPGGLYRLDGIIYAIKDSLSVAPVIKCAIHEDYDDTNQYLDEIHLCLTKTVELQNCHSPHKCDSERKIVYPKWRGENDIS